MRKIIFHIGFGKTGSSSLQAYLSANPIHQTKTQENLLYCCFHNDDTILHGDAIIRKARSSPIKYVASNPNIAEQADNSETKYQLDKILRQDFIPIFSQEDWGRRAGSFKNSNFFEQLDVDVHVIVYVRPQVDWLNSAWWQWFAWDEDFKRPADVIAAWGYNFMLWGKQIDLWKNLPRVKNVTVRLHPSDITEDFLQLLGVNQRAEHTDAGRVNVSLSPALIKLLIKYPSLRKIHSADVDSILSNFIKFEGKTPWIVDAELVNKIIVATYADNIKLLDMLDEPSRVLMKNDPRWWDATCYESKKFWKEEDFQLREDELFSIIEQTIPALIKLSRKSPELW